VRFGFYAIAVRLTFYINCRTMDKVDATMNKVNEQRELANEIADAISNPMYSGADIDEVSVELLYLILHHSLVTTIGGAEGRVG
jgi:hypothetical protein